MSSFQIPTAWWVLPVLLFGHTLCAQTLTLQQALDAALQHHPAARSAALKAQQQQQLLPAAAALADPVLTAESPTGNFYTLGVTQTFSMPGVYRRQKALQQAYIGQAESAVAITQQEIRFQTALAYSEWQYQNALVMQLETQDSLLQHLASAAERQFREGQTDAVAAQFARLQAATLHALLGETRREAEITKNRLEAWTGITGNISPEPIDPKALLQIQPATADAAPWQNNPTLQTLDQAVQVAEQTADVTKSRELPELTLGYINQGERNSPVGNRFNVGISIPLWRKQYNASTAAARTGVEIARQEMAAQALALEAAYRQAYGLLDKKRQALEEYERNVMPAARAVSDASQRLFEGGLTDLVSYLRNRKEALNAELTYWELVREAQVAGINLQYLIGRL